jgi:hypothetical protein
MADRDPDILNTIIEQVSAGKPLREICREQQIGKSTIYRCMKDDVDFAGRFARAREEGFDAIAEEAYAIADAAPEYTQTQFGKKVDAGFVAHQRNRIETRLKLLAKWDPKRYGDKVDLTSNGGPIAVHIARLAD